MKKLSIILVLLCVFFVSHSEENKNPSPILFIYDASGSMWGQIQGKSKMQIASEVLTQTVENLPDNQKIGFVAYGHRSKTDCDDVEFLVDITNGTKTDVTASLKGIKPLGKTPLAYSTELVIGKLRDANARATIILITDGIESCDGNICDVVKAAKEEGIDFRMHIIGFGLKADETEQLKCAAEAGDGQYYDATDANALSEVLNEATEANVDKLVKNFTVYAIKNGKPIDAYIKAYKTGTKEAVATGRSYADTAHLFLPEGVYDLEIKPLENSDVSAVTISEVQSFDDKIAHQDVSFDGGKIGIYVTNNGEGWDAMVKVLSSETGKNVAHIRTYGTEREMEVDPGAYKVEVTALRIKGLQVQNTIENIEVKAGETKALEHNFDTGIAMIGCIANNELLDATVNLKEVSSNKSVAGARTYTAASSNPREFILCPGTYEVTVIAVPREHAGKKEVFTLQVETGKTTEKTVTF